MVKEFTRLTDDLENPYIGELSDVHSSVFRLWLAWMSFSQWLVCKKWHLISHCWSREKTCKCEGLCYGWQNEFVHLIQEECSRLTWQAILNVIKGDNSRCTVLTSCVCCQDDIKSICCVFLFYFHCCLVLHIPEETIFWTNITLFMELFWYFIQFQDRYI